MCASHGSRVVVALVDGPSIVNRFPFTLALSLPQPGRCHPSDPAGALARLLEDGAELALQFVADDKPTGGSSGPGVSVSTPVLDQAYLVYEARPSRPGRDIEGRSILQNPTHDVASRRIYFLEISAVQLQLDIARGERQIHWQSLPDWVPHLSEGYLPGGAEDPSRHSAFTKGYNPHYRFPSPATVAFEWDAIVGNRAVKLLPPLPEDQLEVDDDRARWPCFFPSSLGLITTWTDQDQPDVMPCGSTTVLSIDPLVLAPCVSYAPINQRYAPRKTLELLRRRQRFGCGVAYIGERMLAAIRYSGNVSFRQDPDKVANAGLSVASDPWAPRLPACPIYYECEVMAEIPLGTHAMFPGLVRRAVWREDLGAGNPLRWTPWPAMGPRL